MSLYLDLMSAVARKMPLHVLNVDKVWYINYQRCQFLVPMHEWDEKLSLRYGDDVDDVWHLDRNNLGHVVSEMEALFKK